MEDYGKSVIISEDSQSDFREIIHAVVQVIGVIFVIVGIFFAVKVFIGIVKIVDEPVLLSPKIQAMKNVLAANEISLSGEENDVELGNTVTMIFMVIWYYFLVWIPLAIIRVGGQIASAGASDRRIEKALQKALLSVRKQ